MCTTEEGPKFRGVPIDKWSIREQLCLAEAVARNGDQKWMTVSRQIKSLAEPNRPSDWFSPKNCAVQYEYLFETLKQEKCSSDPEEITPEMIVRKLNQERKMELQNTMKEEKTEFLQLEQDMELIRSGAATDSVVEKFLVHIKEKEEQKLQDAVTHEQWLKKREEQKLENIQQDDIIQVQELKQREEQKLDEDIEPNISVVGQKRKSSEVNKEEECPVVELISLDVSHLESCKINQNVQVVEPEIVNTEIEEILTMKKKKCDDIFVEEEEVCAPETKTADTVPVYNLNNNNNSEVIDLIITGYNSDHLIPVNIPLMGKERQPGIFEIMKYMMIDENGDKELNKKMSANIQTAPKDKPAKTAADEPKNDSSKKSNDDKTIAQIKQEISEEKDFLNRQIQLKQEVTNCLVKLLPKPRTVEEDVHDYTTWKKHILLVYNRIAAHKFAHLFRKPITEEEVPGYHDIIYRPMDLQTIRRNIENGVISSTAQFQRDMNLMFTNAIMFNRTNGKVFKMAREMQIEAVKEFENLRKMLEKKE